MERLIKNMLEQPIWVVVGATQNKDKFGYKIFHRLESEGYEVYPVNPVYGDIEGKTCYPSIRSMPVKPDCINMVVGPDKAKPFIDEAVELGINKIWFQPGAFNQETIVYAEEKGMDVVYHACVLVELNSFKR